MPLLVEDVSGNLHQVSPTHPLPVSFAAAAESETSSSTVTQVASATGLTTLAAANTNRGVLTVFNDSTSALKLKVGSSASGSSFSVIIPAQGYWEMQNTGRIYTGAVTGVWVTANGFAYVTEY